ncbi:MAG: hypothetical protein IT174_10755 [Acidobacteria bacterium]|nr:hypothetical protein [Acidobacteriota bacterium]
MSLRQVEVIQKRYQVEVTEPASVVITVSGTQGPQGPPGPSGLAAQVVGETPAGAVDGSNATFTTAFAFIPESVDVTVNGLRQKRIDDFNTSGASTILLAVSPGPGEKVLINYLRA